MRPTAPSRRTRTAHPSQALRCLAASALPQRLDRLDDLHRRRKQPTPLLLQSEESRPRRTLGGSIKDCVEILGKQFALLFANPPTGVGLGMLLATLRLRSGKEALKDGFQSGQSIHDAQLDRFQLQAPFRQIAEQTGP